MCRLLTSIDKPRDFINVWTCLQNWTADESRLAGDVCWPEGVVLWNTTTCDDFTKGADFDVLGYVCWTWMSKLSRLTGATGYCDYPPSSHRDYLWVANFTQTKDCYRWKASHLKAFCCGGRGELSLGKKLTWSELSRGWCSNSKLFSSRNLKCFSLAKTSDYSDKMKVGRIALSVPETSEKRNKQKATLNNKRKYFSPHWNRQKLKQLWKWTPLTTQSFDGSRTARMLVFRYFWWSENFL